MGWWRLLWEDVDIKNLGVGRGDLMGIYYYGCGSFLLYYEFSKCQRPAIPAAPGAYLPCTCSGPKPCCIRNSGICVLTSSGWFWDCLESAALFGIPGYPHLKVCCTLVYHGLSRVGFIIGISRGEGAEREFMKRASWSPGEMSWR